VMRFEDFCSPYTAIVPRRELVEAVQANLPPDVGPLRVVVSSACPPDRMYLIPRDFFQLLREGGVERAARASAVLTDIGDGAAALDSRAGWGS
jgi:hypothetical protein